MAFSGENFGYFLQSPCFERIIRRIIQLPTTLVDVITRAVAGAAPAPRKGFVAAFEEQYGNAHPSFLECRFSDALRMARAQSKLMFAYLHHNPGEGGDSAAAADFCSNILCSELVVEFLDANFVSWGAVAGRGEGAEVARSVEAGRFPFCAVVGPIDSGEDMDMVVLQKIEGPVSPEELVETLQRTMEEYGSAFWRLRGEGGGEESTTENRPEDGTANICQEEEDGIHDILIEEIESIRTPAEKQQIAGSAASTSRSSPTAKRSNSKPRSAASTRTQRKEPTKTLPITQILIRFPNGERRQQGFPSTDTIQSVYKYVDSLKMPGIGSYRLISSFPRKVYGYEKLGMTLDEVGLHPKATLFLELGHY